MQSLSLSLYRIHPAIFLALGLFGLVLSLTGFKEAWVLAFSSDTSGQTVQSILDVSLASPLTGLLSGIIITSLIQSSSATIAIVVATVGAGVISIGDSVYILMGANIGTTITNTIVGLAHSHKQDEFARVTPAIIIDDIYKILNVSLFFIIEVFTGLLHKLSVSLVAFFERTALLGGFLDAFPDLIDMVTEPITVNMINLITWLPLPIGPQAMLTGLLFFLLLMLSLAMMGEALQVYLHDRSRALIGSVFEGKYAAFGIGFLLCWLLQSSSVTVSLIIPLVSQSAVTLQMVYYYSIGAAVATTCDASQILSYLKFGPIGLTAGMVHILMNVFGAILFLMVPGLNQLPVKIAGHLSAQMCRYRHAPLILVAYVLTFFFGLPFLVISLARLF